MAVLRKIFSSLKRLFKRRKQRRKQKPKVGRKSSGRRKSPGPIRQISAELRKPLGRARRASSRKTRAAHSVPPKNKKAHGTSSAKKSHDDRSPSAVSKARSKSVSPQIQPLGRPIGEITHFFSKIQVVVVKIGKGNLSVGDKIRIQGKSTDFTQTVRSLQIESVDVRSARSGQLIGLKVEREAKVGDKIYKLV